MPIKYVLTDETKDLQGEKLYRIRYTDAFIDKLHRERGMSYVKREDFYGFIKCEANHPNDMDDMSVLVNGPSVADMSVVSDGAVLFGGDTQITGNSSVKGDKVSLLESSVWENSKITGKAAIDHCVIGRNSVVDGGDRRVSMKSSTLGNTRIMNGGVDIVDTFIHDSTLTGPCRISSSNIAGSSLGSCIVISCQITTSEIRGADLNGGHVVLSDITAETRQYETKDGERAFLLPLRLYGSMAIRRAVVHKINDVVHLVNFWSSGRSITYTKSNDQWSTGCFEGNTETLLKSAEESDAKDNGNRLPFVKLLIDFVERTKDIETRSSEWTGLDEDGNYMFSGGGSCMFSLLENPDTHAAPENN